MDDIKEQLRLKYPFLRKTGTVCGKFDVEKITERKRGEKLLVLMVGVQGSGKTTYCKKHFSEYPVINLDDILIEYLARSTKMFNMESNREINLIFFEKLEEALETEDIAVVDAGTMHPTVRVLILERLQKKFDKAILIVLNPSKEQIIRQVRGQLDLRARPGLWSDILSEYELLQQQIQDHILEMGADEVYML